MLGDTACEHLEIWNTAVSTSNDSVDYSTELFSCTRALVYCQIHQSAFTYRIQMKENALPVVHAARRVPAPLTDILSSYCPVMSKDITGQYEEAGCDKEGRGTNRLCQIHCTNMDPKDLNENIKHEHYKIRKGKELTSEIAGARYFSKLHKL